METQFGQYQLLERIAAGGMGEVYLARITRGKAFQKVVAVKKILPELTAKPTFMVQFENEARFAARLNHANIVSVYDYGARGDEAFLAMEYVDGVDLASLIDHLGQQQHLIALPDALAIALGLSQGLDYLHRLKDTQGEELGLVHQDISPQNILLSSEGEVKLTDFGLVRAVCKAGQPLEGKLLGKLAYMAPEQIKGGAITRRSDLFSAGCVLFEMVTGAYLLAGASNTMDLATRREAVADSLRRAEQRCPAEVLAVIARCVDEDPEHRYPDAKSFSRDLRRLLALFETRSHAADLAALVRSCPGRRQSANLYMEEGRTLVASRPIAGTTGRGVMAPTVQAEQPINRRRSAGWSPRMILALGVLVAVAGLALLGVWWFLVPDGTLSLTGIPSGARILVDETPVAVTGADQAIQVYGQGRVHTVKVEQRLFQPFAQQFSFEEGDHVELAVTMARQRGALVIETVPPGASVSINGTLKEQPTPVQVQDLEMGVPIELRLERAGSVPFTGVYTLTSAEPMRIHHRFEAISLSARVVTTPADALVYLDGRQVRGESPFIIPGLTPDQSYSLEVSHRSCVPAHQVFIPRRGKENQVEVALQPLKARVVLSPPEGFALLVDGKAAQRDFMLDGEAVRLVLLKNSQGQKISLRCKLIQVRSTTGLRPRLHVNINANPWARLALDGQPGGVTPMGDIMLGPGNHQMAFSFGDGGKKYTATVKLVIP